MYKLLRMLLLAATLSTALASPVNAEAPENTFKHAVEKMKAAGSIEPLVDFVDWGKYYDSLTPEEQRGLGFRSGDDMQQYYRARAKSNGQDKLDKFTKLAKKDNVETGGESIQTLGEVREELNRQQSDMERKIRGTVYTISDIRPDGENKVISFTKQYEGQSSSAEIVLVPSGGGWLFRSAAPLNPLPSPMASPIGALPEPTQVLFNP